MTSRGRKMCGAAALSMVMTVAGASSAVAAPQYGWISGDLGTGGTAHVSVSGGESWLTSTAPVASSGCVYVNRRVTKRKGQTTTTTTVTESGCGTLSVFLPAAGAGTIAGEVTTGSGTTLRLEDVRVALGAPQAWTEWQEPTCSNHPYYCIFYEGGFLPRPESAWVRRDGSATGSIASSASGRHGLVAASGQFYECVIGC